MIILICALGYYLYSVMGWGSYQQFRYGILPDPEIKWIDAILYFIFGKNQISKYKSIALFKDNYALLGMSLRGLHIAPLFIALAWHYSNPFIICLSWGMMLQGLIYYVFNSLLLPTCVKHNIDCNACAEYATGALIGVLIIIMKGMI